MHINRTLTIAGMAGTFRLSFRDLINQTHSFKGKCSGKLTVERSPSGNFYSIHSTTDDFRVEVEMLAPDDLKDPVYSDDCTAFGWWELEGFKKVEFTAGEEGK